MAEGRLATQWDQTVEIVAMIHNVNCTKRSSRIKDPSKLNPIRASLKPKARGSVDDLAGLLGA